MMVKRLVSLDHSKRKLVREVLCDAAVPFFVADKSVQIFEMLNLFQEGNGTLSSTVHHDTDQLGHLAVIVDSISKSEHADASYERIDKVFGVVTLEDIIEELIGSQQHLLGSILIFVGEEIVDETDVFEDVAAKKAVSSRIRRTDTLRTVQSTSETSVSTDETYSYDWSENDDDLRPLQASFVSSAFFGQAHQVQSPPSSAEESEPLLQ